MGILNVGIQGIEAIDEARARPWRRCAGLVRILPSLLHPPKTQPYRSSLSIGYNASLPRDHHDLNIVLDASLRLGSLRALLLIWRVLTLFLINLINLLILPLHNPLP